MELGAAVAMAERSLDDQATLGTNAVVARLNYCFRWRFNFQT